VHKIRIADFQENL